MSRRLVTVAAMKVMDLLPEISLVQRPDEAGFDGFLALNKESVKSSDVSSTLQRQLDVDKGNEIKVVHCPGVAGDRLIYSSCGTVSGDYDDSRCFYEAAIKGTKRAVTSGCKSLIVALPEHASYPCAGYVTLLGVLNALYKPIELREAQQNSEKKMDRVGVICEGLGAAEVINMARVVEAARTVARDIHGADPERMSAPRVEEYVRSIFQGSDIGIEVVQGQEVFEQQYPLLAAVNRASVERHQGRVIKLNYTGKGDIHTTLMLVGKGVTYDTGGADIKAGGIMAGMHRDKGGAAAVAGFFKLLELYKPPGIKVFGAMSMVRNQVGADCYVSDEIITSRAGVRVRVGNTDAEGRMAMTDPLCEMKELAASQVNPMLFTFATLTGHVIRCFGKNYASVLENGPARSLEVGKKVVDAGNLYADPCERTSLRREDFEIVAPQTEYEDVMQASKLASALTSRGHQYPAAFMIKASGLDKHGNDSANPIPYTHMDIAGAAGVAPDPPTASPILSMAHAFVLKMPKA